MSYLKIFPRSIVVKINGNGDYVGQLIYDFEQYGRMIYDDITDVSLLFSCTSKSSWHIYVERQAHSLAGFTVFMRALNHYMFDVLHFDPVLQLNKISSTEYEYYFERVYFDLGTRQFISMKNLTVPATAECLGNFYLKQI